MYFIQRIYVAVSFEQRICIFIFLLLSLGSNNNNLKKLAPSLLNLPYAKETTDRIGRILNIHNIKTIFKPPKKIAQILKNSKDQRPPLNFTGIYKIPCSCGQVYIGIYQENGQLTDKRTPRSQAKTCSEHYHNIETLTSNAV